MLSGKPLESAKKYQTIHKPIVYEAHQPVWWIEDEQGTVIHTEATTIRTVIYYNYAWLWDTDGALRGAEAGVFRVHPLERLLPLDRTIIVTRRKVPPKKD